MIHEVLQELFILLYHQEYGMVTTKMQVKHVKVKGKQWCEYKWQTLDKDSNKS